MRLRGRGDALRAALGRAVFLLMLLVACASATLPPNGSESAHSSIRNEAAPTPEVSGNAPAPEVCEYRNVFVEFDSPAQPGDPRAEPLRRAILKRAVELLPELGWVAVAEPSDAYWRLFADGWMGREGVPLVHLGMRGELKLGRHLFVVSMADESFPFRGGLGGSYNFANASLAEATQLDAQVEAGMRWIRALDSAQIDALCEVRKELIDEGWTAVEEVRQELIEEMEQVRRARARSNTRKSLEIEVEGQPPLERAE